MKSNLIRGMLAVAVALLPMTAMSNTVFHLDSPVEGSTVFGLVEVTGWILDDGQECGPPPEWQACEWGDAQISSIDLFVDDVFIAGADLNQPRWDVLQAYPWYAGTPYERPGFSVSFDASHFVSGEHTFFLRVTFSDMTKLDYGTTTVTVDPLRNQAPFGELELPGENQPMNGVYPVTGWALDDGSIAKIEVLIDGVSDAVYGTAGVHRPDISYRFPTHPGAEYAGFIRMFNTSTLTNGVHSIAIRLTDNQGAVRVIGQRFVQTFNTAYNLPPFGGIDWPEPDHIMYSDACWIPGGYSGGEEYEEPDVVEWVSGWALDVGSRTDPGGVAYVQLLVDGVLIKDTMVDAFYYSWFEHLTELVNAYGLPRMDIANLFPDVPNAKDAGFFFAVDVSDLIKRKGFHEGLHLITIRAGDWENNVTDIAKVPVIFDCNNDRDRPSWGAITDPDYMEQVGGTVEVKGWAIDLDQVEEVEIWLDGQWLDNVDEFYIASPEIEDLYPWLPNWLTANAKWSYDLDTLALNIPDGQHKLVVWTQDHWDGRTMIAERPFVVNNNSKVLQKKAPADFQ